MVQYEHKLLTQYGQRISRTIPIGDFTTKTNHLAPSIQATGEHSFTIKDRLLQAGLKVTRPRILVLSFLQELGGHHSIEAIVQKLKERGTPLPRASVYNSMAALLSRRLVMLADAGPGPALYELYVNWHHHFICIDCCMIVDIPCVKGEKPCLLPEWVPGVVEEAQVLFRGRCTDCLARTPGNTDAVLAGEKGDGWEDTISFSGSGSNLVIRRVQSEKAVPRNRFGSG